MYLALLEERGTPSTKIFARYGITKDKFFEALSKVRGNQRVTSQNPEDNYDALSKYGRDLVDMAREGKLDPVIGRDAEIRHTIQMSPAWARPPLQKAWRGALSTVTCRKGMRQQDAGYQHRVHARGGQIPRRI